MPYENLGGSKCRLGSFEGELGQEDDTAASSATSGVLTGVGQILGSVGQIGAQFYAAHAQSELAKERLKLQQRQPAVPQPQFIPQPPPQSSALPIILIVLAIVVVGGIIIYSQDDEGASSPSPVVAGQTVQQPYAAQPRAKIIRRRVRKKPKKK